MEKFDLDPDDGHTIVRTLSKGTVQFVGFSKAYRTTTLEVTDSPTLLPVVALDGRNSFEILNKSKTDTLYIGNSDVTADSVIGETSGREVIPGETYIVDIKNNLVLYGRAETGKTILVKVTEVA